MTISETLTRGSVDPVARLRTAVAGDATTPLVLAGNFEVEHAWADGQARLPTLTSPSGVAIVNRMDEFALLLGSGRDTVLLKSAPDRDYLAHLEELGFDLPRVHVVAGSTSDRSVTADACGDPASLDMLRTLGSSGALLYPHGTSPMEQALGTAGRIALATPSAAVCRSVNSKVFSRRLADRHGIPQPAGFACSSVDQLAEAVEEAARWLDQGPVAVKEAFGVSGKGIALADTPQRLRRLLRLVAQQAERGLRVDFTVERWVDKAVDLNYQVTVDRAGVVSLDVVKKALTEGGVHRGHQMPVRLERAHEEEISSTAQIIGSSLFELGYTGVIGVDALIERDGTLHPVIEINARNNMATYQLRVQQHLVPSGHQALAKHWALDLVAPTGYRQVRRLLGDVMIGAPGGSGLLVNNFATVNAAYTTSDPSATRQGRLYGVLVARSGKELRALDRAVSARLDDLAEVAA
jgi:hypothetical protein